VSGRIVIPTYSGPASGHEVGALGQCGLQGLQERQHYGLKIRNGHLACLNSFETNSRGSALAIYFSVELAISLFFFFLFWRRYTWRRESFIAGMTPNQAGHWNKIERDRGSAGRAGCKVHDHPRQGI